MAKEPNIKLSQLYQKYLRGADLPGPLTVEIVDARLVTVRPHPQEPEVEKWCLFIKGLPNPDLPSGILIGPKMVESLMRVIGNLDVSELKGKRINIRPETVRVAGKELKAIRFAAASPNGSKPAPATDKQPPEPDDTPF